MEERGNGSISMENTHKSPFVSPQAWYTKYIAPSSKQRAKLSIHVIPSGRAAELTAKVGRGVQPASSLDLMKRGWKVHTPTPGALPAGGAAHSVLSNGMRV